MIFTATSLHYSTLRTPNPLLFPPKHPFRNPEFRVYRRRRLKPIPSRRPSPLCNLLPSPFSDLLDLHILPQSLTLASLSVAAALLSISNYSNSRSKFGKKKIHRKGNVGSLSSSPEVVEWILYSSPTPFNRFVFRRCPSISFADGADEKLVTEDRHFVRVNSGRMRSRGITDAEDYELEYQRVCVGTEDGGVVSIDWPENLEMREERALDTTVVVIPGTTEGSMDARVRGFVKEALQHGFFPVVVNPRGCAGSPITTAR